MCNNSTRPQEKTLYIFHCIVNKSYGTCDAFSMTKEKVISYSTILTVSLITSLC